MNPELGVRIISLEPRLQEFPRGLEGSLRAMLWFLKVFLPPESTIILGLINQILMIQIKKYTKSTIIISH